MDVEANDSGLAAEMLRHLDGLYNFARWLTPDPREAEDLVQETYYRAIRAAHQSRPGTNLRAWLFHILRNTFYTEYRRQRREPEALDPRALDQLSSMHDTRETDQRLAGPAEGAAGLDLTAALNRLPETYRSVVLLADLEDFTMEEIAPLMDCPVGTVKSRLFRAREILKQLLRDYTA